MANAKTLQRGSATDVIKRYGWCMELVPMDPNFHDITVGLYVKDGTYTVWTFSRKPGVEGRLEKIRDQLVALGGLEPVEGTHNQARLPCGQVHERPIRFLLKQAVEKAPDLTHPDGPIEVKDLRSALIVRAEGREADGRWVYSIASDGEAKNKTARLRAVAAGLTRYGEMEKVGDNDASFPCGYRHDELTRITMPYARNVSKVEDMLAGEALRGQMTTGTLGFTPPT